MKQLLAIVLVLALLPALASAYEGQRENSALLNGTWEVAVGSGDEPLGTVSGQSGLDWNTTTLPGQIMQWPREASTNIKFVWAKRRFQVSDAQAASLAVLRWNRIMLGATAFINGRKVGENEPAGPYQVVLPPDVLRPGENEIILRITGPAGVRRAKNGNNLVPAGFASGRGGFVPELTDDIWIDFSDRVYVKWALAMPDLGASKVRIRVTPTGLARVDGLTVSAEVRPWPEGEVVGRGTTQARLVPDPDRLRGEHFFVEVPMPGFKPWTPEDRNLYTAHLTVAKEGRTLDELSFRFGMREIKVADGNYKLNGKNLWLRGNNLVSEWNWAPVKGHEMDYLVTEAREMSANCFRTHTQPPPKPWADICDEYGTLILAEFSCLYNWSNYQFTPEEYAIWHQNTITDAAGWMTRLWNHPAVIMWVLSNESPVDGEWETGPYQDFVLALDPTRPTMRTATAAPTGTRDNYDVHKCHNIERTDEGHLQMEVMDWFDLAEGRTLTNTEYMNYFKRPITQWTGTDDGEADGIAVAQIGMEHTEAMRRARLDGILPYMYAGWTRTRRGGQVWKANFASPLSAVWHSSLSLVLASLDLFDPNYLPGQKVTTDLWLINETWHDTRIHVDLLLTKENPEFIPEAKCFLAPVAKWSFNFEMKADTVRKTPVMWQLPAEPGNYWLTARTTGVEGRPVLSQRFVRAIPRAELSDRAKQKRFVVLGSDARVRECLVPLGLSVSGLRDRLVPGQDVVIVWNASALTAEEKAAAPALCDFAAAGGRVMVLATRTWDWPELCQVTIEEVTDWWEDDLLPFSRVFAYEGVEHPMLAGIDREWLMRWNGLPGTVAVSEFYGPALEGAEKLLWGRKPELTVAAEVPAAAGDGKVLFCQLDLQEHMCPSSERYDPVAERVLFNLLGE